MADKKTIDHLEVLVREHRANILRLSQAKGKMHLGGDMSCAELLVVLYQHALHIDPQNPQDPNRDRFVLSKGHGAGAMYLAMAQAGYFETDEIFRTYKGFETKFGVHPCKAVCPELDTSSGSLGHGLPISCGLAAAARLNKKPNRVFCLLGDGELDEGTNWEAALNAPQLKLGNLIGIIDRNGLSLDGPTEELVPLESLRDKWMAFGWNVIEVDGHDIEALIDCFDSLPSPDSTVPTMIIANTVKGKGISFMENNPLFHNAELTAEQFIQALKELGIS